MSTTNVQQRIKPITIKRIGGSDGDILVEYATTGTGINGIRGGIGLLTALSQSFYSVNPCTYFPDQLHSDSYNILLRAGNPIVAVLELKKSDFFSLII
jgi:hypothetical protein